MCGAGTNVAGSTGVCLMSFSVTSPDARMVQHCVLHELFTHHLLKMLYCDVVDLCTQFGMAHCVSVLYEHKATLNDELAQLPSKASYRYLYKVNIIMKECARVRKNSSRRGFQERLDAHLKEWLRSMRTTSKLDISKILHLEKSKQKLNVQAETDATSLWAGRQQINVQAETNFTSLRAARQHILYPQCRGTPSRFSFLSDSLWFMSIERDCKVFTFQVSYFHLRQ